MPVNLFINQMLMNVEPPMSALPVNMKRQAQDLMETYLEKEKRQHNINFSSLKR